MPTYTAGEENVADLDHRSAGQNKEMDNVAPGLMVAPKANSAAGEQLKTSSNGQW